VAVDDLAPSPFVVEEAGVVARSERGDAIRAWPALPEIGSPRENSRSSAVAANWS
jgi:hypothetical protein